jgi:hypothetical protein
MSGVIGNIQQYQILSDEIIILALDGNLQVGPPQLYEYLTSSNMTEVTKNHIKSYMKGEAGVSSDLTWIQLQAIMTHIDALRVILSTFSPTRGTRMPNGDSSEETGDTHRRQQLINSMLPKMSLFSGKPEDGDPFLDAFILQTKELEEDVKIHLFGTFCGPKTQGWFNSHNFTSWEVLKESFRRSWCEYYEPLAAFEKTSLLKQGDDDFICTYIAEFEKYRKYFKEQINTSVQIERFLSHCRAGIKKHALQIKSQDYNWEEFLASVQELDNKEPRPLRTLSSKKPILTVEGSSRGTRSEDFVADEDKPINEQLADLRNMFKNFLGKNNSSQQSSSQTGQGEMTCHNCGGKNHLAKFCRSSKRKFHGKQGNNKSGKGPRK